MRTLRFILLAFAAGFSMMGTKAQIGYQISLLNTATGEPRANETVTVSISLSNNTGKVFHSETKSATTNDFGVLSLSIGNADTFKNIDLNKIPFFIEVTANGVMIGKSQILSVPIAEVAKQLAPIDKDLIVGTWRHRDYYGNEITLVFNQENTGSGSYPAKQEQWSFTYEVEGNNIYMYESEERYEILRYHNNALWSDNRRYTK